MVIQSIQTNGIVQEMIFEPSGSIIFFDGTAYFFDTKQTTVIGTRTLPFASATYDIYSTSELYPAESRDSIIRPHLQALKDEGHISENIYNELVEKLYDLPLYRGMIDNAIVGTGEGKEKECCCCSQI